MRSIRFRMTAVMVVAILTSILSLGGVGLLTVRSEVDHSSIEKMNLISENEQLTLDGYLSSLKQSVDMVFHKAQDSLDRSFITKDLYQGTASLTAQQRSNLDRHLQEHCDSVLDSFSSVAAHTSGVETYYYCISSNLSSTVHGFFYAKRGARNFERQEPIDSALLDPDDLAHTTWYYTPIQKGCPIWVGPYTAYYLDETWTVSYLIPVYKNGVFIGVMGMDILFDTLMEQVWSLKVYHNGYAFLMTQEGEILYHPELEMGSTLDQISEELDPGRFHKTSSKGDLIRCRIHGEEWQLSYSTLSSGLKLVVMAPVSEITQSWRDLTAFGLLVAAAILSLFTVLSLLIMGAITKPLLRLTTASRQLAEGNYDVDLDYEGDDEVGVLTNAFRQLRDHLKIYISDLNGRAYRDALTGVKNKGAFDISAERLNDAILRDDAAFAVVMFDCNSLKQINDVYGHGMGDHYLLNACRVICRTYAHSPVFRLGGDEFAALLQGQDYRERNALLYRFDRLSEDASAAAKEPWQRVNVAVGMAEYRPGSDTSVEEVLKRADEAMYEAKRRYKQGLSAR